MLPWWRRKRIFMRSVVGRGSAVIGGEVIGGIVAVCDRTKNPNLEPGSF
jgi:hypothetical protein